MSAWRDLSKGNGIGFITVICFVLVGVWKGCELYFGSIQLLHNHSFSCLTPMIL